MKESPVPVPASNVAPSDPRRVAGKRHPWNVSRRYTRGPYAAKFTAVNQRKRRKRARQTGRY